MGDKTVGNIEDIYHEVYKIIPKSKPFILVAIIASLALVAAAVSFNAVQDVYDGTDVAQLQADFDNHKFMIDKDLADMRKSVAILDADHHGKFNAISNNFTSVAKTLDNHNTQLIVLRAANQISIPSVSQGAGDFDLKTINLQTFQLTEVFPQNMPVYITGAYDGLASKMAYDIFKDGILYDTGNPSITAGTFTFAFNANGNAEKGDYVVTVVIDGKKDTIMFEIT